MKNILIVDKYDQPTGSVSLNEARQRGLAHRIVRLLIFNQSGELLLQLRGPEVIYAPNTWETSAAGFVDEGETYKKAIRREVQEELGLRDLEFTQINKSYRELETEKGLLRQFIMLYAAVVDDVADVSNHEVAKIKWIKTHELSPWIQREPEAFTEGLRDAFMKWQSLS